MKISLAYRGSCIWVKIEGVILSAQDFTFLYALFNEFSILSCKLISRLSKPVLYFYKANIPLNGYYFSGEHCTHIRIAQFLK